MQIVVYADILIFLNSVITFIMLMTTAEIVKVDTQKIRYITGSLVGGVFSLIILAPEMGVFLTLITRIVICVLIVIITFRINSIRIMLKCIIGFLTVSFLFAGIMYCISMFSYSNFILFNNGYVYFNFSVLTLIGVSGVIFLAVTLVNRKIFVKQNKDLIFRVKIEYNNNFVETDAFFDTGNSVVDVFTGRCVILVDIDELINILDGEVINSINEYIEGKSNFSLPEKMRLLPVKTLGEAKMIPVFTADKVTVTDGSSKKIIEKPGIGITSGMFENKNYKALINEAVMGRVI